MNLSYIWTAYKAHIRCILSNKLYFRYPELKQNAKLKDQHKGEHCFILGSGHSILEQDLTKLQGQIVFTQNHFHAHEDIGIIKPKYHCVVPKYQSADYNKDWMVWFASMEEKLPQDTIFFHGWETKKLIDQEKFFVDRCYYIHTGLNPIFMKKAVINIVHRTMDVPTALTQCLTIALYMGFSKIYLLGFDMDQIFRMSDRNKVRFYGVSPIIDNDSEKELEQEYAGEGEWFYFWLMWKQFNLLKKYAGEHKQEIINLTQGGLLNCYKRQSYDEVIDSLRKES